MESITTENKNGICKYSETELKIIFIILVYIILKNLMDTDTDCKVHSHGQKEKEFSYWLMRKGELQSLCLPYIQ